MTTDSTFNAAEHIAAILDSADAPAVRQFRVGRWAALTVRRSCEVVIVTIRQPDRC